MTISTETRKAGPFIGPSNALNFPFHFKVFSPSDVAVFRETNTAVKRLVLTTDYSVTLSESGGTVTLKTALGTGERLVIESAVPLLQPLQLENQGGFYPHVLNDAFDRSCMQIQQLAQTLNRAVLVPETSDTDPQALIAELKADKQAAQQSASAAASSASSAASSASAANSSKTAAASSATAAQTSATQAASSATAAASSASAANTSKTQAQASASQAATSATNAASSASAAQTSATNAATSATSATQAANSATQAATSATNAASSATTATNQANAASVSKNAAATSATQAEAHKNKAQAWADNNENQAVETGKYSAKHWAAKAQQTAASVNAADINAQLAAMQEQIDALQNQVNNPPPAAAPLTMKDVRTQRAVGQIYTNASTQGLWFFVGVLPAQANDTFIVEVALSATDSFITIGYVNLLLGTAILVVPPGGRYRVLRPDNAPNTSPGIWFEYSDL